MAKKWRKPNLGSSNRRPTMNISSKKLILVMVAQLGPVIYGLAGFAAPASAQNVAVAAVSQSDSTAGSMTPSADSVTDDELRTRVRTALHSDPYFYDQHVNVSVENGDVVLRGFVFSDWDLQDAIRIAGHAAQHRTVVDDLSIERVGRH
jgi:osmotically-inducible protein OsmY